MDRALLGLTRSQSGFAAFQAMVDGIAQHVFKGRHHALQHAAVQLAFGVAHHQLDLLAQLARHLPHHALQARHQAFEGHH